MMQEAENLPIQEFQSKKSPWIIIGILLITMIVLGVLIGTGLIALLAMSKGIPLTEIQTFLTEDSTVSDRNFLRNTLLIQHLTLFILPAFITGWIIAKRKYLSLLSLDHKPLLRNALLGIGIFLAAFPLIQYSYSINKLIPLPEWAMNMEDATGDLINNLLITTSPIELIFNVFLIGIIPGIGEELIFRGIIQKNIARITNNPVIAIWITAIIFSAFHFQFQGFIPRMLLGALLGYLFYWTNNLWVPIIAHAFNNGIQVIMQYLYSKELSSVNIDDMESVPLWMALVSVGIIFFLSTLIFRNTEEFRR